MFSFNIFRNIIYDYKTIKASASFGRSEIEGFGFCLLNGKLRKVSVEILNYPSNLNCKRFQATQASDLRQRSEFWDLARSRSHHHRFHWRNFHWNRRKWNRHLLIFDS